MCVTATTTAKVCENVNIIKMVSMDNFVPESPGVIHPLSGGVWLNP